MLKIASTIIILATVMVAAVPPSMNTTKPYHIFSKSSKSYKKSKVDPAKVVDVPSVLGSLSLSMPFVIPGESKAGKSKSSKSSPCSNSTYHQLADIFDYSMERASIVSRVSSKVSKQAFGKSEKRSPSPQADSFRLRIYWEDGYRWQGSPMEMFFCMESNKKETNAVFINECNLSAKQQWIKVEDTLRPLSDTSLCMTVTAEMKAGKPVRLIKCDGGDDQKITGLVVQEGVKFEIYPAVYNGTCFTQHHHPCADEIIYPEDCEKARRHKTSFWVMY